ncbi:CTTNBP2 N-terminal like b isoform X1 [Anguilla anguilla]|uniref:CTTNBP2 N-terminal like b isoform X1 n=2 Tax=Anguilla anguilla TaxID=7936 RepID=UPI0015A79F57|nr:CTTNBP2 N-terminal like b isoform X1 [Anguilla anguilla]
MGKIKEAGTGRMKESRMNMDKLSQPELLTLFSILEGELEARDLVIEALRAQQRDAFVQERYGRYDLSDPFLALQRDGEAAGGRGRGERAGPAACPNPLAVLKLVMAHCKRMQERMMGQLAAVESRHRKVIADLEEEKRRHAQDTAEGDDVTYMLEKERERLLQQLDFEQAQVQRLEKEQQRLWGQAEQERHRASAQAREEGQRVAELGRRLEEARAAGEALRGELEEERRRAQQKEARAERQLAELDTEREQLRARLRREEGRSRQLREELEGLRQEAAALRGGEGGGGAPAGAGGKAEAPSGSSETDGGERPPSGTPVQLRVNGHHAPKEGQAPPENGLENGTPLSPAHPHPQLHPSLSPCSTASSSLASSPCSSPVLAKRLAATPAGSPGFQSPYQASVNQRFQAARHKFQTQAELEQHQQGGGSGPQSPRDLSPTTTPPPPPPPEHSAAKQLARNTVTQVLSRFTCQQGGAKPPAPNNSPFGTDYRSLASPTKGPATSPLSAGVRSPTVARSEKTHPPPIPAKKPGLSPSPASPTAASRSSPFPELSGSCGLSSGQEGAKELDLVMSSTS